MNRPRIAVTLTGTQSDGAATERQRYLDAVAAAGGEAIGVQAGMRVPEFDGLFLSGGKDVSPEYGGARDLVHPKEFDRSRDAMEIELLSSAIRNDQPVLAVCRGFQLLNVYMGGTLRSHVDGHIDGSGPSEDHNLTPVPGSRLARATGHRNFVVNSRHHQALDRVGDRLVVTANVGNLVEAVEHDDRLWVVGVQWHPERTNLDENLDTQAARALIIEFVRQARMAAARAQRRS